MEHNSKLRHARRELVALSRSLFDRGYVAGGAGNISVRVGDREILATPTGACLGRLSEEHLSLVNLDGTLISGPQASKETKFHLALYRNDPDCGSVVHLHSTWLTALACRTDLNETCPIQAFTPYYVMKIGQLQVIPYYPPGDQRIAQEVTRWAGRKRAFLLRNHGGIVTAETLSKAVDMYEELEETAKLYCMLDREKIQYLSDAHIQELS